MRRYVDHELGLKPHNPKVQECLANIAQWRCAQARCRYCPEIKAWLGSSANRDSHKRLDNLPTDWTEHVEEELKRGSFGVKYKSTKDRDYYKIDVSVFLSIARAVLLIAGTMRS
jgi:hypothetical protein